MYMSYQKFIDVKILKIISGILIINMEVLLYKKLSHAFHYFQFISQFYGEYYLTRYGLKNTVM